MNTNSRIRQAAAASLVLVQPTLHAQESPSSVQLYGNVSIGITQKNNMAQGAKRLEMTNSLLSSSLFGIRGREDLGDGTAAVFRLESGFDADSGTPGNPNKFWSRQSTVGIEWGKAAALTFGRQFHASTDRVTQSLDVYNVSGPSLDTQPIAAFGVNRFVGNDTRADNSVKLRLGGPAGLTAGFSAGLSEGTSGRSYAFDVAQITPDYTLAAYGVRFEAPKVIAATGQRPVHQVLGFGGNLPIGPAALYLNALRSTLDSTSAGRPTQKNVVVSFGTRYAISNVLLKAAYTHDRGTDLNGVAGRNGTKQTGVISAEYFFSRRTAAYVAAFSNRFSDGYRLETLNIAALNRDPSRSSTGGYSLGMRHQF